MIPLRCHWGGRNSSSILKIHINVLLLLLLVLVLTVQHTTEVHSHTIITRKMETPTTSTASDIEMDKNNVEPDEEEEEKEEGEAEGEDEDEEGQEVVNGDVVDRITASTTAATTSTSSCPLWDMNDGWIVLGVGGDDHYRHHNDKSHTITLQRNDTIPGLLPDIMILWKQYSTRSFPRWQRHYYFFPYNNNNHHQKEEQEDIDTNHSNNDTDYDDHSKYFIFAPGYKYPLECHQYHANLYVNYTHVFHTAFSNNDSNSNDSNLVQLNQPIIADRMIKTGDPIFLPCSDPTLSALEDYDKFLPLNMDQQYLQKHGDYCINPFFIYIKEITDMQYINEINGEQATSTITTKYYGTFTNHSIPNNTIVVWGVFVPIHRSELYNPITQTYELLYNYCYAPSSSSSKINTTSPLLLLPIVPGVNGINHADRNKNQTPNVRISWMEPTFDAEEFFTEPTELLFGSHERSSDSGTKPSLLIKYVTIRPIEKGEELLLDYGTDWENAYHQYQQQQQTGEQRSVFRQPIGLPDDMIPKQWLEQERIVSSYREWDIPKLQPGQLQRMQLSTIPSKNDDSDNDTRQIQGMVDRIGLPLGMAEFMAKWADEMGITNILKQHVRGALQLPPEGERRLRLNGTTWWVKRFPENWRSDMHYISPDDFDSNQMFMNALADAGFDTILNAVGTRDNLTSITVYYPSYIAVSHCTTAFMHNDSEEDGHYNIIFPVIQVNNSKPELIVGDDEYKIYAPYKYETDHAVVLGKLGDHGTAPCDYRGTDSIRVVVSVYMVDSDNIPTRDKVLREWVNADPPYPRVPDRMNFLQSTKHWMRNNPQRTLRTPLVDVDKDDGEEVEAEDEDVEEVEAEDEGVEEVVQDEL